MPSMLALRTSPAVASAPLVISANLMEPTSDFFGAEDSATVSLSVPQPEPEPLNVITGTARINKLVGTGGNDLIWGLAGNDWLEGKDGEHERGGGSRNQVLTHIHT